MKRKIVLYLVADIIVVWITLLITLYLGFVFTVVFHLGGAFILIWYIVRTLKWLRILFDKMFSKPQVIHTKEYRLAYRAKAAQLFRNEKSPSYSIVLFNDNRLPGKYICFDVCDFNPGIELEILYYPQSKYIIKITPMDEDVRLDQQ